MYVNKLKKFVVFSVFIKFLIISNAFAANIDIQSHLAVYEINLKKSRVKDINDARWRMVIEITKDCKGYSQKQRMGLKLNNPNGSQFFSDYNYYTWESVDGDMLSFSNKNYLNGKLRENYTGNAVRGDENIFISFEDNPSKKMKIGKEIFFPTQYFKSLIESSVKESKIFEKKIYDGSGPEGVYNTVAVISKPKVTNEDKRYSDKFNDIKSSWVNIAYFADSDNEPTPDYQAEFNLYSNGVITNLTLDYERFIIKTKLVKLEYLKSTC